MVALNLPAFDYVLKKEEGKVFILDIIRKKFLFLTPEEWVRQHFIHYMLVNLQYPRALIKVEGGLSFNRLQKRTDIVVFNRDGNPWMVVECKAPRHKLSQNTLRQASVYNHSLRARYLTVTNGLQSICCEIDWVTKKITVLSTLPVYQ